MSVKLKQKQVQQEPVAKAKSKSKQKNEVQEKVDEFVKLKKQLEHIKPQLERVEELRKWLQAKADEFPEDQPVNFVGLDGEVTFSPNTPVRQIKDMQGLIGALKAKIGYDALLTLLSITLKDIDQYLTPVEAGGFLESKAGARKLSGFQVFQKELL